MILCRATFIAILGPKGLRATGWTPLAEETGYLHVVDSGEEPAKVLREIC